MSSEGAQQRRKELRHELAQIEKQIFDLETSYLEETREFGNVFVGWDNYLNKEKQKVRKVVGNDERLFSLSSMTSPASRKAGDVSKESKKDLEMQDKMVLDEFEETHTESSSVSATSRIPGNKRKGEAVALPMDGDLDFLGTLDDLEVEF